uniref:AH domain-containing protein n=1 Tax=Caenorhabditis tropicalis TaxID=1561998 RepID=A0A1I7TU32_9PELO
MVKDIQMLEKKVNILKESVIQLNKAYYKYAKDVDMNDLMQQVKDMVTRTQVMEKKALAGNPMDEKAIEKGFRTAMESLYGIQSSNPKLVEESKKLADEMRVFRDAAANKNFYKMIGKPVNSATSSGSFSASSSESSFCSSSSNTSSASASSSSAVSSIQSAPSSTLFS